MIPGIDPKIDIAFKKLFGSEGTRELTKALINAVLQPTPGQQLKDLELLNPYSEKMTLDDKLSILDIKARDEHGRFDNVEMQMVATTTRERDETRDATNVALVKRIQLCERLLKRPTSDSDRLVNRGVEDLRDLAEQLERELTHSSE